MHIVCISASNIRHARTTSTSTKVCQLIVEILASAASPGFTSDVIPLVDYELTPCHGCGGCYTTAACRHDAVFNALYARVIQADALFVVAAHYAPIPAKLCMLLEKMEQLAFLPRFHDEGRHSPLYHKPVGIIGHSGNTEAFLAGYKGPVLDTIANALSWPLDIQIVGVDEQWPNGIIFPVKEVRKSPDSIFPIQEYDWDDIRRRIAPLVYNVCAAA